MSSKLVEYAFEVTSDDSVGMPVWSASDSGRSRRRSTRARTALAMLSRDDDCPFCSFGVSEPLGSENLVQLDYEKYLQFKKIFIHKCPNEFF